MKEQLTIGLFGYGCVGKGLYHALQRSPQINARIKKIVVKNKDKQRDIGLAHFSYNKESILNDPEINLVIELIDDAQEAFHILKASLKNGKPVITANKRMLAAHLPQILQLQQQFGKPVLYEAAVGGSIPIIRAIEEYYSNDVLLKVSGILNGTTNFILSTCFSENTTFAEALKTAQQKGFAERNPVMDIDAFDPKFKLTILLAHAFGKLVQQEDILNCGIANLSKTDIAFAKAQNCTLKLVAQAYETNEGLVAYVLPQFVSSKNVLYAINDEFNGIEVSGKFYDTQLLKGKGAGSFPTAAAVLADISAIAINYQYPYQKLKATTQSTLNNQHLIKVYLRYNTTQQLTCFNFKQINEKYEGDDYNYVVGLISLDAIKVAFTKLVGHVFIAEVEKTAYGHKLFSTTVKRNNLFFSESIH